MDTTSQKVPETTRHISLERALNVVVIILITLAVIAQLVGMVVVWSGRFSFNSSGFQSIYQIINMASGPGFLLAFAKLLLNMLRIFKDRQAKLWVLVYLLITLLPSYSQQFTVRQMLLPKPTELASPDQPESEDFYAGKVWARENTPLRNSDCSGAPEFARGCLIAMGEWRKREHQAGIDWARENQPVRGSECAKGTPEFIAACHVYFRQHLRKSHSVYDYKTTAECAKEVDAFYGSVTALDREKGNDHAANVKTRNHWMPSLRECDHLDDMRLIRAYDRLNAAVNQLKQGAVISDADRDEIRAELDDMRNVQDQPYKAAYYKLGDEYQMRLSGEFKEPVVEPPQLSCVEFKDVLDDMRAQDRKRVEKIQILKDVRRAEENSTQLGELNEQHKNMMWEWKRYTDGAKTAGCEDSVDLSLPGPMPKW